MLYIAYAVCYLSLRHARAGVVVAARENDDSIYDYAVTREVIADLQAATDARGRSLTVHILENPATRRSIFCLVFKVYR